MIPNTTNCSIEGMYYNIKQFKINLMSVKKECILNRKPIGIKYN